MAKLINKIKTKLGFSRLARKNFSGLQAFYNMPGKAVWSGRNYNKFSDEGYIRNVIAHSAVNMIAAGAASVPWVVQGGAARAEKLQRLLARPNPSVGGAEFFETLYSYKLINGNAYLQAVKSSDGTVQELYTLRPDRVEVIAGKASLPMGYRYKADRQVTDFKVDYVTGQSDILHIKNFHPLDDWYGLSNIEAAAYSIDQHNQAGQWNQSLLQNAARPSGALIVNSNVNDSGYLSEEQYERIKSQVEEIHSGPSNAGRPILLEGGLEWKEMSLSPRDMDFLNIKNSAARDIALAFGVPPQLLGIPGDNRYNNMAEARLALWEQTIIPLLENTAAALNNWLTPIFGKNFTITYDKNSISALIPRRESLWASLKDVDFITDDEKRRMVGV